MDFRFGDNRRQLVVDVMLDDLHFPQSGHSRRPPNSP
jgi:hypothetical protein